MGDTEAEILWWVPGEMHTEEWKEKVHNGVGKWYEREPVTLDGHARSQRGLSVAPRRSREVAAASIRRRGRWTCSICRGRRGCTRSRASTGARRSWRRSSTATSGSAARSCRFRRYGESQRNSGDYERLIYVESGTLSVNLTASGTGLIARPRRHGVRAAVHRAQPAGDRGRAGHRAVGLGLRLTLDDGSQPAPPKGARPCPLTRPSSTPATRRCVRGITAGRSTASSSSRA